MSPHADPEKKEGFSIWLKRWRGIQKGKKKRRNGLAKGGTKKGPSPIAFRRKKDAPTTLISGERSIRRLPGKKKRGTRPLKERKGESYPAGREKLSALDWSAGKKMLLGGKGLFRVLKEDRTSSVEGARKNGLYERREEGSGISGQEEKFLFLVRIKQIPSK